MEQLSRMLSDIPETERLEALEYYENYFDDAGPEQEAQVIQELGSPGKVAAMIKAEVKGSSGDEFAEYTEHGYQDSRAKERSQTPVPYGRNRRNIRGERNRSSLLILAIIGLILISPFLGGSVGIIIAVLMLPFAVIITFGAGSIVLFIAGIGLIGAGIAACFAVPAAGVLLIGIGFLLLSLGILFMLAAVWAAGKGLVGLLRKITGVIGRLLNKQKGGRS